MSLLNEVSRIWIKAQMFTVRWIWHFNCSLSTYLKDMSTADTFLFVICVSANCVSVLSSQITNWFQSCWFSMKNHLLQGLGTGYIKNTVNRLLVSIKSFTWQNTFEKKKSIPKYSPLFTLANLKSVQYKSVEHWDSGNLTCIVAFIFNVIHIFYHLVLCQYSHYLFTIDSKHLTGHKL